MQVLRWIGISGVGSGVSLWRRGDGNRGQAAKASQRAEAKGEAPDAKVDGKVNINAVSKADLMKLDGIGAGARRRSSPTARPMARSGGRRISPRSTGGPPKACSRRTLAGSP